MSAEFPELERLLDEAAERHYGARTASSRASVTGRRLIAGGRRSAIVAAALVAVLATAAIGIQRFSVATDDEQPVSPAAAPPSGQLAAAYEVFARPQGQASALEMQLLGRKFVDEFLDRTQPITTWLLHRIPNGGVVAMLGTSVESGQPTLCLFDDDSGIGGGGCTDVDELAARDEPLVESGTQQGAGDIAYALVPDNVASVRLRVAGGSVQEVPIENNLAYAQSARPICAVEWTNRDGSSGHHAVSDPLGSSRACG